MLILIAGLLLWTVLHLSQMTFSGLRNAIAERIGEVATKAIIAVLLVGSIYLMSKGYTASAGAPLWALPAWFNHVVILLMLLVLILFFGTIPGSGIGARVRHPQLTAFKLWALLHLIVNGDMRSIILFGGLLAWAVFMLILTNKRDGKGPLPAASDNPFVRLSPLYVGTAVWTVFMFFAHQWLFGVSPIG